MSKEAAQSESLITRLLQLLVNPAEKPIILTMRGSSEPHLHRGIGFSVPNDWDVELFESSDELVARASESIAERFTIVVPPWGRDQNSRLELHETALLAIDPSRARFPFVAHIPNNSMVRTQGDAFRRQLFSTWHPSVIANVQGDLHGIHAAFNSTLLVLTKGGDMEVVTLMFQAPSHWDTIVDDIIDDFLNLQQMRGGSRRYGYILRALPAAGERLDFRSHDPNLKKRRRQLTDYGSVISLGELFEVLPPSNDRLLRESMMMSPTDGSRRSISGRDILREHQIATPDENANWVEATEASKRHDLAVGDIVVRRISRPVKSSGFVWARIHQSDLPAVASGSVLTLRKREKVSTVAEDFVLRFLSSRQSVELIDGVSTLSDNLLLTPSALRAMRVPVPDEHMETTLTAVHRARDKSIDLQEEADAILGTIFDDDDSARSRQRILRESRTVRWHVEAAETVSDISGQVRSQYPYPLAYRWRVAEALYSSGTNRDTYLALLDAGEQVAAYVANIGLALARKLEIQVSALAKIRSKLMINQGPGFGDWNAIIDELSGRRFSDIDTLLGDGDLRTFCRNANVSEARYWLSARRNDEAHMRRADDTQLDERCREARSHLLTLMKSALFLVDAPLVLVKSTKWDSLTGTGTAQHQTLAGDHPVVRTETMTINDPALEAGSLYLLDINQKLHLLRPFLIAQDCPVCRNLSIFHVDILDEEGVYLKSLENGHSKKEMNLRQELRFVGLIEQ